MSSETQAGLTQSVSRALKILSCFNNETATLRVTDIASRLDLTPSLVSRLLITLEHEGFIERDKDTGYYLLGKSIIALAGVALNHNTLVTEALSEMQKTAYKLGLGVNLAVLDGNSIFYLAHVDGWQAPRSYTLLGRRNPLHATAMGKMLLAHLPEEQRADYLQNLILHGYTVHTILDSEQLKAELDQVHIQGWALEMEELALGRACIAGPVRDRKGSVVAALSISGPLSALNWEGRSEELITTVIEVADQISSQLGYITAPRLSDNSWRSPQPLPESTDGISRS